MGCAAPNPLHWQDLRQRPEQEILRKKAASLSSDPKGYRVSFLGGQYLIDLQAEQVTEISPEPARPLSQEFQILLIRYLSCPMGQPPVGDQITEKELPGGATFFRGPHELPVHAMVERFGADPDAFEARGTELGGRLVDHGDRAIELAPFPEFPMTVILWRADSEFPASISVMLDRTISTWLESDMIFLLIRQMNFIMGSV